MKKFLSRGTFFALILFVTQTTFAQQSCQRLFEKETPARQSKLLTPEQYAQKKLESMDDFREVYANEDLRAQIHSRDLFRDHAAELLPSLRSVVETLFDKLKRMSHDPDYSENAAFLYLKQEIPLQISQVWGFVNRRELSYMNYIRNGYSLIASLNLLTLIETQQQRPNSNDFFNNYSDQLKINLNFTVPRKNLGGVPQLVLDQLRVKDISSLNMNEFLAETKIYNDVLSSFASAITQLKLGRSVFIFYGRPSRSQEDVYKVDKEDFIKMDGKDVFVVEAIDTAVNPHGSYWGALGHANHDLFHANQMILPHTSLRMYGLREDWFSLRDKMYARALTSSDIELKHRIIDWLYDVIHERTDLLTSYAKYHREVRLGRSPQEAFLELEVEIGAVHREEFKEALAILGQGI